MQEQAGNRGRGKWSVPETPRPEADLHREGLHRLLTGKGREPGVQDQPPTPGPSAGAAPTPAAAPRAPQTRAQACRSFPHTLFVTNVHLRYRPQHRVQRLLSPGRTPPPSSAVSPARVLAVGPQSGAAAASPLQAAAPRPELSRRCGLRRGWPEQLLKCILLLQNKTNHLYSLTKVLQKGTFWSLSRYSQADPATANSSLLLTGTDRAASGGAFRNPKARSS